MNVASLKLSKQLYEVSGWGDTDKAWGGWADKELAPGLTSYNNPDFGHDTYRIAPAYDLGYLLRKLPGNIALANSRHGRWYINLILMDIRGPGMQSSFGGEGETIEDAATKLCIELFTKHILHKGGEES